MEIFNQLGIHGPTLAAQVVNFLALVVVLRFVLYKPLLKIFEEREAATTKLKEDVEGMERRKKEADAQAHENLSSAGQIAQDILARAKRSAVHFKEERLQLTEKEIDRMIEEGRRRLQAQHASVREETMSSVHEDVGASLRKLFSEGEIGRVVHDEFLEFVKADLARVLEEAALSKNGKTAEVASAYELEPREKRLFENILKKRLALASEVVFVQDAVLLAGVRIKFDSGHLFDFSLAGRLEKELQAPSR